jgi:multisubunit Na+/H+ antiporter MnhG subunit
MNRPQPFIFSGAVLALSMMLVMSAPISAHAIADESGK